MNIGIYDPYLDDLGGGEKYMMTIASCLSQNHNITIFWDNQKDVDAITKRFNLNLKDCKLAKNIFTSSVSTWERLKESNAYDVLIILSDGSIPLVLSKKVILHIQQPLQSVGQGSIIENFKRSRVAKIFYNSEYTSDKNKDLFGKMPSTIIYPPVTHVKSRATKENIILHVGRFRPMGNGKADFKKQNIMLEAFASMVDKGLKDWKFIVASGVLEEDKEAFRVLKKTVQDYPVTFLENISSDDLDQVYAKAKIYWHASGYGEDLEKHPEMAEHFGISTVEAMSSGAVPVVINAGGQREIVTDGVNGLVWDSEKEMKEKTLELINDKKLLEKLSQNAKKRANDFSLETFCQQVKNLIT